MTYAVEFHGPRHKILCYYNANIPFSFVYFACMMKQLILATLPFYADITWPLIGEKNNVSFHNEYKTIIRQIQIIGVKYIRNNIWTVIKQFSDL